MDEAKQVYIKTLLTIFLVADLLVLSLLFVTIRTVTELTEAVKAKPNEIIIRETQVIVPKEPEKPKPLPVVKSNNATIDTYVREICKSYKNISPELVMSVIYHESRYDPTLKTGNCVGLMQVSTTWHTKRARKLGVSNLYDPYGNILTGVDYLSELFKVHKDPRLVLMLYNMNHDDAFELYSKGKTTYYVTSVLRKAEEFRKGVWAKDVRL